MFLNLHQMNNGLKYLLCNKSFTKNCKVIVPTTVACGLPTGTYFSVQYSLLRFFVIAYSGNDEMNYSVTLPISINNPRMLVY